MSKHTHAYKIGSQGALDWLDREFAPQQAMLHGQDNIEMNMVRGHMTLKYT